MLKAQLKLKVKWLNHVPSVNLAVVPMARQKLKEKTLRDVNLQHQLRDNVERQNMAVVRTASQLPLALITEVVRLAHVSHTVAAPTTRHLLMDHLEKAVVLIQSTVVAQIILTLHADLTLRIAIANILHTDVVMIK